MGSFFDEAFQIVVSHEGSYSADPRDPGNWTGGKPGVGVLKGTKYGIAANTYPYLDIKNLTLERAKAIYKRDFWDNLGLESLSKGVALLMFDTAVNMGKLRARIFLKQSRGDINEFCARRGQLYGNLSTFGTFGLGWMRRLMQVHQLALQFQMEEVRLTEFNGVSYPGGAKVSMVQDKLYIRTLGGTND